MKDNIENDIGLKQSKSSKPTRSLTCRLVKLPGKVLYLMSRVIQGFILIYVRLCLLNLLSKSKAREDDPNSVVSVNNKK